MSGEWSSIARCIDLQEAHIAHAVGGRETTRALLGRLASVSAPDSGAAKVLLLYARMATTACDWIDGDLCVDLVSDGNATVIEACTELGGGLRERLFPPLRFEAPLDEFARALARAPHLVAPRRRRAASARRIALSASEMIRRSTAPPPPIDIAAASLFVRPPAAPSGDDTPAAIEDDVLPGLLPILPQPSSLTPRQAPRASSEDRPIPQTDEIDAAWEDEAPSGNE